MINASNDELIRAAEAVLNPRLVGDRLFADVAAALVTTSGNRYVGVCIDTSSGTGRTRSTEIGTHAPTDQPGAAWNPSAR
jgi:hypothetical protein